MPDQEDQQVSAGEIFIRRLAENGVDYFFANAGTDFAPIIEALARAKTGGFKVPEALVIPHETAAVGMAHGYYLATGRPQAVMVHTNVGLANAVMGMINAASDQAPMLVASGISPVIDDDRLGHRTSAVAWGQNMRDQVAMVREVVKWDAVIAYPEQTASLVDRAFAASLSHPRGPVYLGLPREALCAQAPLPTEPPRNAPTRIAPHPEDVAAAARLLDAAERPLIIAHRRGDQIDTFAKLTAFAEAFAIPVVEAAPASLSISGLSLMHAGFDPGAETSEADLILVLDAAVPWLPHRDRLARGVKVIQAGPDPWHLRTPVRSFPADISLAGSIGDVIDALDKALPRRDRSARFDRVAARCVERRQAALARKPAKAGALTNESVSQAIAEILGEDGRVVTELGARCGAMRFVRGDQYYANPISGGLGWGLPAALGIQLADRERLVVAAIGDGSYMFANPVACHQIAQALSLPILTIVFNNGIWNAVRHTTLGLFPGGHAAQANEVPLTSLQPSPDYGKVAEASGAWAAKVETEDQLLPRLREAVEIIRSERRQALVEVRTTV